MRSVSVFNRISRCFDKNIKKKYKVKEGKKEMDKRNKNYVFSCCEDTKREFEMKFYIKNYIQSS